MIYFTNTHIPKAVNSFLKDFYDLGIARGSRVLFDGSSNSFCSAEEIGEPPISAGGAAYAPHAVFETIMDKTKDILFSQLLFLDFL